MGIINALLADIRSLGRAHHPRIFISYRRRGEGAGYGGRVADKLVEHFGARQCFRDVDNIESGVDFVKTIREAVGACEVLVAVIGPDWATQADERGARRLDDVRDFVRLEVAAALERDIRVIPVLVGGADVPTEQELPDVLKPLSRRQARELTDTRWEYDVTKLVEAIESIGIKSCSRSKRNAAMTRNWKMAAGFLGGGMLALLAISEARSSLNREPSPAETNVIPVVAPADERRDGQDVPTEADAARWEAPEREDELDQVDTFNGTLGRVGVTWQHEGVVYDAIVVTNGPRGIAQVQYVSPSTGIQIAAEQDLELLSNASGVFYVGSNTRLPGTDVPHPSYRRDIFKLARTGNGSWTISEVGDDWQHFDTALTTQ